MTTSGLAFGQTAGCYILAKLTHKINNLSNIYFFPDCSFQLFLFKYYWQTSHEEILILISSVHCSELQCTPPPTPAVLMFPAEFVDAFIPHVLYFMI